MQSTDLLEDCIQANGIWRELVCFFDMKRPAFERHRDAEETIGMFDFLVLSLYIFRLEEKMPWVG